MRALRTAASGMAAQQLNVEVISNNIANMNTVGFKRQRAEFQDLLYQTIERAGSQSSSDGNVVPTGVQVGGGVKAGSSYGQTDDFGYNVVSGGLHIHDFHATLMHLLGIDHEQLTYKFQGRRYRLTDVHGHVVKELLA